ncbi:hypothetical protein Rumeso_02596 [Rubellimicrobium mesophilum DSM 19309]|uniref:Uncharacterized protein n=1 Tax=Rubellimicrobium mesophilum DSM 19309 TaxID=442562 RepID=A0A017HPX1_9RHOB|nr:hypothetical protein Rumeso_02596 [Rubellimicrobium mesophilum DSM 19309]
MAWAAVGPVIPLLGRETVLVARKLLQKYPKGGDANPDIVLTFRQVQARGRTAE